ncbi:MAG: 3-oxoacyl-[acyl-carrier-protein] synthase III C-terminal domain-containing protein [Chloroflexota bacterium]
MSHPRILSVETGVPANQYRQHEVADYFLMLQDHAHRERAIRSIFDHAGVGSRYMVVEKEYFAQPRTTQDRNDRYMQEAIPLGENVIARGLAQAGLVSSDIDDFIVVSCTGFSIPGLDLLLAAKLGMRPDLQRTCILGMGCYGAFPGMRRAFESVIANPGRTALVLTLELCSLHLQPDPTAENVVSSALFSDGAAMVIIGEDHGQVGPRIIASKTFCDYSTLDHMSFSVTDHGFQMYLSSYVPDLLTAQVDRFVDELLASNNLRRSDIPFWGIHPGSSKIVDYIQSRLGLNDAQVECSHSVLYSYGNMSSATILFVLDHIQRCSHPSPGDYGVLLAFGPGLTMEGMLVQW